PSFVYSIPVSSLPFAFSTIIPQWRGNVEYPFLIPSHARKLWVAAGFYLSPHHFYIRFYILRRVEGVHQPVGDGEIPFGRHRLEGGVDVLPALDCQQQLPRF